MFRLIRFAFLSAVILFLVVTAISLLIPSRVRISKAINLAPPGENVLALIGDRQSWPDWHPLFAAGDTAGRPYFNTELRKNTDSLIVFAVWQEGRRPVINGWQVYRYASTDSVTLQWYMDFDLKWYPWQKFGSLFYENTYGVMMEQGLTNIKKLSYKTGNDFVF